MRRKCYIMGLAMLLLLCVMCSGGRSGRAEQAVGRTVRFLLEAIERAAPGVLARADEQNTDVRVQGEPEQVQDAGSGMRETSKQAQDVDSGVRWAQAQDAGYGIQETQEQAQEQTSGQVRAAANVRESRDAGQQDAERIVLDVPEILQLPELPTGCEATALSMALAYDGVEIDKTTVARDYLVYNYEDENMALGYVGDPFSEDGAGCFAPAIRETAERIFEDRGIEGSARDISGTSLDDLLVYVSSGRPVIVWTSMYMAEPEFTGEEGRYQGRTYRWYRQEHCVVLSGYDLGERKLQINDPLEGIVWRDMDAFGGIYDRTGQNAVVLYIKDGSGRAFPDGE